MELAWLRQLAELVKAEGLSALSVEENGIKVRIENMGGAAMSFAPAALPAHPAVPAIPAPETAAPPPAPAGDVDCTCVKSPMVGVFRSLEKMGRAPLESGATVTEGTVVCGVEAMKMICDIEAECAGTLVEYLCKDGDSVEFGQPLAKVKKG